MTKQPDSRRQFLRTAGLGAMSLAGAAIGHGEASAQQDVARQKATPPADGRALKLGFASYQFKEFDLDQSLAMTRRLGVKFLCLKSFHLPLDSSPEEIAGRIEKIRQAGITAYGGGVITMSKPAEVDQAFAYAKAAGFRLITANPTPEMLPLVAEKAVQSGIQVAIHNHGPEDKLYPTPASIYEKIQGLDRRVGICLDTGHTQRTGTDPSAAAAACADRLLDIHLKDVVAATPNAAEIELGRGIVDVPTFLRTLMQIGYQGVISLEHEKDMKDPLPGIAESVGYARGVWAALQAKG